MTLKEPGYHKKYSFIPKSTTHKTPQRNQNYHRFCKMIDFVFNGSSLNLFYCFLERVTKQSKASFDDNRNFIIAPSKLLKEGF